MKAIIKYIKETITFPDLGEGEFIDITEKEVEELKLFGVADNLLDYELTWSK